MHRSKPCEPPRITDLFAALLGAVCGRADPWADTGRAGCTWQIDPQIGSGSIWLFPIDEAVAFFTCSFSVRSPVCFAHPELDCFFFGAGCLPSAPDAQKAPDCLRRALIGRVLRARESRDALVPAHTAVEATGAALLPAAVKDLSLACHCDPLVLMTAISSLDGTRSVPELSRTLDAVRTARPGSVAANAYYRGKLLEACSQLVDWQVTRTHYCGSSVSKPDRIALDRVVEIMKSALGRAVTTEELCHAACMSATKLSGLFKQTEGKTPQEYLRDLRMDEACRLLATTDLTMADIAATIGYSRQSSFSEAFKSCHGMSPRAYRTACGPASRSGVASDLP